jgi:hypothetical protein
MGQHGQSLFYTLDDDGNPVPETDACLWGIWYKATDRHVGLDQVGDVKISTVFLGIDHQFGIGPPVLWETMIFGGPSDGSCVRYTSLAAAIEGHAGAVIRAVTLASDSEP